MNKLDSILEDWKKNRSVENLISEQLFSDETAIQTALEQLDGEHKDNVLKQLTDIEIAIQIYIEEVAKEQKEIKQQMNATLKSAKACLSYGSSIDIQNKGRE